MSFRDKFRTILEKKEVQEGKDVKLEKNDFLALVLAAASVFLPIILLFCAGVAIFIWLFLMYFN